MRRVVDGKVEKQTSLLLKRSQKSSVYGAPPLLSLERKMTMVSGVGGRITSCVWGGLEEQCR